MHEQLKFLIELQDIDSVVLSAAERIEQLPRTLRQYQAPLKEANDALQKSRTKYEALNKKKKDCDMRLDEVQDKISKMKSRAAEIKTNKEYEAHLREIEGFEKSIVTVEDEILVIMEEIESFEKNVKDEEMKVKSAEDDYRKQEKRLGEDQEKLKTELDQHKAKRDQYTSRIDKDYYKQYMVLLKRLGDKAVVETKNEVCLGCHTNIPPQLFNDIKRSEKIYTCFYCKRFLYYLPPAPPEEKSGDNQPEA